MIKHDGHYDICRACSRAPKIKVSKEPDWGAVQADALKFAKARTGAGHPHHNAPSASPAVLPPPPGQQ
jgi:hypothetical protein